MTTTRILGPTERPDPSSTSATNAPTTGAPTIGAPTIDTATLRAWLLDDAELAVLDVRTADEVGYASPLFATNLPADRVLAEIATFVPRPEVRTALIDGGDGAARRLVEELRSLGRGHVVAVEGGIPAWTAQDGQQPTFDIPGREFSLAVRDEKATPALTARELKRAYDADENVVVIDTRTLAEFEAAHVPGAVGVPGAELLLRFTDVVPDPATRVVVSCAGLPRAILGAQTLIDAGVPNPVAYLVDGTKGWQNEGLELQSGATATYGPVDAAARHTARERAAALSSSHEVIRLDLATARQWAADRRRTTYLLDVRTPEEFAAAHLAGSISAEGGQLLGVAYRTIAVRGARVVLVDDPTGARASVVAHWLRRRGFEIAVLLHDFAPSH